MQPPQAFTPHGAPIRDRKLLPAQPPGQPIGRNRELASMHLTLKARSAIFLSGPTGIGKTALAAVLATAQIASNPAGVLWFNMLEDDLRLLIARVGRAYNLDTFTRTDQGLAANMATVRALLDKQHPLIVLDGLIDVDVVRDFARQCAPGTALLVTNELAGVGPWTPIELEPLSAKDSQSLFYFYSGLQDASNDADIEALVKFLDNFPMTLELAARQVSLDNLTAAELISMLPSSTGHDSQQVIMALSFKRLDAATQGLLLVLAGMFTGSASAELLATLSNVPTTEVIPLMRNLVAHGIVRESVSYGQFAYTLAAVAQNYARAWLKNYQRLQSVEDRALQSVLAYAERHANNTSADHDRLAAEIDNIVGAAAYATSNNNSSALKRLIHVLSDDAGDFVQNRHFQPELSQLQKLATLIPDRAGATEPIQPIIVRQQAPTTEEPKPLLARLQTDIQQSVQPIEEGTIAPLDTAAIAPDAELGVELAPLETPLQETPTVPQTPIFDAPLHLPEMNALDTLLKPAQQVEVPVVQAPITETSTAEAPIVEPPITEDDTENPTPLSMPNLERQLAVARSAGDHKKEGMLLQIIGHYYLETNDTQGAFEDFKQALDVYDAIDDRDGTLAVLDVLAMLAIQMDNVQGALVYATRGVNLAAQAGDNIRLGRLQTRLGDVRLALNDVPSAIETYTQAVSTLRQTEDWTLIGLVMSKLGAAYLQQNQPDQALQVLEPALTIFRKEQRHDHEGRTLGKIALAHTQKRNWEKAADYNQQSLAVARDQFDLPGEAAQLAALAHLHEMQGDHDEAIIYYRQALHAAYVLDDRQLQAAYALPLGTLLMDNVQTLSQSVQLLREADSLDMSSEAKRLLHRADQRLKRSIAAGVTVPLATSSNQEYAAAAKTT